MKSETETKNYITFGTDGIRGNASEYPFTQDALRTLAQAITSWAYAKYKTMPHILIGHDTRESCLRIKTTLIETFMSAGVSVTDAGVIPTPALFQLLRKNEQFHCGIVISASHNPFHDNGIKLFDRSSGKLNADDEQAITDAFCSLSHDPETTFTNKYAHPSCPTEPQHRQEQATPSIAALMKTDCGRIEGGALQVWKESSETYCQNIISSFPPAMLRNVHIVLDCAHGATYNVAPTIFKALGAHITNINCTPNGKNINETCGAVHPNKLVKKVLEEKADFGFGFDGDGDRVIGVSNDGTVLDGDDLLCILLTHPAYADTTTVVGTVMTNLGLELHLFDQNKELKRVKVGDKYIAAELEKNNLLIGGETSGHIILRDYLTTGDGIFVALRVLDALLTSKNVRAATFTKCPQVLINVPIQHKKDLKQSPFAQLITDHEDQLKNGRMIVRYSGTENVLRVMAEDQTLDSATHAARTLALKLQQALR